MTSSKTPKPLVQKMDIVTKGGFTEELLGICDAIEAALMHMGAVPGEDYSSADLVKMAEPYVLSLFNSLPGGLIYYLPGREE